MPASNLALREKQAINKLDALIAIAVFALSMAVYIITLAPSVTGEDSGELIAASYLTGIAHPPGYPLWCLSTKPFFMLPVGDIAYRANLASAFWGALTVSALFLLARRWGYIRGAAVACALVLAFSQRFWSQCVITEVYTLNTFMLLAVLHLVESARPLFENGSEEKKHTKAFLLLGLIFGLSLTNHYMLMLLVAPGLALLLLPPRNFFINNKSILLVAAGLTVTGLMLFIAGEKLPPRASGLFLLVSATGLVLYALLGTFRKLRTALPCAIALWLLGLSVYAYLPLAASQHPFINWGNPDSLEATYRHVSRTSYRDLEFAHAITINDKLAFISQAGTELLHQFTLVLIPFALIGLFALFKSDKRRLTASLAIFLLNTVVLITILHFQFDNENRQRMEVYYLPAYAIACLWIGAGMHFIAARMKYAKATSIILPMFAIIPLYSHFSFNDKSDSTIARAYNENILATVEENAVIFPSADYTTFPLIYLIGAEKKRSDVLLADKYGTITPETHELFHELAPEIKSAGIDVIANTIARRSNRPVYLTSRSIAHAAPGMKLFPQGLVYRLAPASYKPDRNLNDSNAVSAAVRAAEVSHDSMDRGLAASYYRMMAETCFSTGRISEGKDNLLKAMEIMDDDHKGINNLGSIAASYGQKELAIGLYEKAAAINPRYSTPLTNLANMSLENGDVEKAEVFLNQANSIDPDNYRVKALAEVIRKKKDESNRLQNFINDVTKNPEDPVAHNNLATAFAQSGNIIKAIEHWKTAVRLKPDYALAYKNLYIAYTRDLPDPAQAQKYKAIYERLIIK